MVRRRQPLPDIGELVIGTVKSIFEYGAYVTLDEYGGLEAFLPRGEVSSKWVRNIREHIREGQKAVFKVIRVNKAKKQVDISLRRVSNGERRNKLIEWKRAQKAEKILELAAQKIGKSLDEAYDEVGWKLEDFYGEIYAGFEEAFVKGEEALREAGVSEEWIKPLMELIKKHIELKKIKISGILTLQTLRSDGIEVLKKILTSIKSYPLKKGMSLKIYTIGAPRYRIDLVADEYKEAEKTLANIVNEVMKMSKKMNVYASFERLKTK